MNRTSKTWGFGSVIALAAVFFSLATSVAAQENTTASSKVMGELHFVGATKVEKDSGVWVDGNYVGFLKELKGNKKVLLIPGGPLNLRLLPP